MCVCDDADADAAGDAECVVLLLKAISVQTFPEVPPKLSPELAGDFPIHPKSGHWPWPWRGSRGNWPLAMAMATGLAKPLP